MATVDAITHALTAWMFFPWTVSHSMIWYAMLGAVIPDVDILLKFFSDRDPRLFIFTHGGFTHSVAGALVSATGAFAAVAGIALHGSPAGALPDTLIPALLLVWAGALTHIALDALAYPGIPLLYPFTTRKYTLGIFPGPSLFLFGTSILFVTLWVTGLAGFPDLSLYALFMVAFILVRASLKGYVAFTTEGVTIPTFHPLRWMEIRETPSSYELLFRPLNGKSTGPVKFLKTDGVNAEEIERAGEIPEVQRMMYYSYLVIAERTESGIMFRDPLREGKYVYYPPYYTRALVSEGDRA